MTNNDRVASLDYLRGLMALSIVLYHYFSWHNAGNGSLDSDNILGRLGIYAVSTFYILSGLSLTIAYHNTLNHKTLWGYFVKRVFRIFPLMWLAITAALALEFAIAFLNDDPYSFSLYKTFLNYSLLFGFIDPAAYIPAGAWSIGNEMVFYAFFPLILILGYRWPFAVIGFTLVTMAVGAIFSFLLLDKGGSLDSQWAYYINPFNQIFLFFSGVVIGKYARKLNWSKKSYWIAIIVSALVFCCYPANGDKINIVSGVERIVFSFSCISFVAALFLLNPKFQGLTARGLEFIGRASYSIYLMHPIIATPVLFIAVRVGLTTGNGYFIAFLLTLVVGWLTYRYLESPMIMVGKNLSKRLDKTGGSPKSMKILE